MRSGPHSGWIRVANACLPGILAGLLVGCAASGPPPTSPSVTGSSSSLPATGTPGPSRPVPSPSVPADGVSLAELGLSHGPGAFSVPRTAQITTVVDQPNTVALVFASPAAADLAAYLRRALPGAGFRITGQAADPPALQFAGRGWTGSFTGSATASAVNLRPG